ARFHASMLPKCCRVRHDIGLHACASTLPCRKYRWDVANECRMSRNDARLRRDAPMMNELRAAPLRAMTLSAVFSSSLGVGLIFGFQPPLIALVLSRLGASAFEIGAVTSASLIAVIVCGPLYPRLIGRFGLKRCIVSGILIAAVLLLAMPLRPGVPM